MAIRRAHGQLTRSEIVQLSKNYNIIQLNGADAAGHWPGQADDARRIVALDPSAKVYAYYPLSYMGAQLIHNIEAFDSDFQFPESWYLHDAAGQRVAFSASNSLYFVDLSNAQFRAWLVATIAKWMRAAPWAGIKYDIAEYLAGNLPLNGQRYGSTTMNDLLCGHGIWDVTGSNCPRVSAWNEGLRDLIHQTTAVLHPLGKTVLFNGIAPTTDGGAYRMLGLLTQRGGADGALDESFCFRTASPLSESAASVTYTNVLDDIAIMQSPTYAGKQLLFQSNYLVREKLVLAHYCIAAFLMGWQPGRDFYRFGQSYSDNELLSQPNPARGTLPVNGIDEIDLNLGNPLAPCLRRGDALYRRFVNGFVAVNVGALPVLVRLPPTKLVEFRNGRRAATFMPSTRVRVAPHDGVFFLRYGYLHPANDLLRDIFRQ